MCPDSWVGCGAKWVVSFLISSSNDMVQMPFGATRSFASPRVSVLHVSSKMALFITASVILWHSRWKCRQSTQSSQFWDGLYSRMLLVEVAIF